MIINALDEPVVRCGKGGTRITIHCIFINSRSIIPKKEKETCYPDEVAL
jgi:hypothetical protein